MISIRFRLLKLHDCAPFHLLFFLLPIRFNQLDCHPIKSEGTTTHPKCSANFQKEGHHISISKDCYPIKLVLKKKKSKKNKLLITKVGGKKHGLVQVKRINPLVTRRQHDYLVSKLKGELQELSNCTFTFL